MAGKENRGLIGPVAAAVVAALVILAGCGSSDDSTSALTKEQYLNQGNAICTKWQKSRESALSKAQEEVAPPVTQDKINRIIVKVLEIYEGTVDELSELQPPEKDQETVDSIIASMEESAARAKAHPPTLTQGNLPFKPANEEAEAYGLTACTA